MAAKPDQTPTQVFDKTPTEQLDPREIVRDNFAGGTISTTPAGLFDGQQERAITFVVVGTQFDLDHARKAALATYYRVRDHR
jgi:hypothetical protein